MTLVLFFIGVATLCMPRWLAPLTRRLDPHEGVRISVTALVFGASLVELSLILFAVPAVLRAAGISSLVMSCRFLGDLAPGGFELGWLTAALAVLFPALARRGLLRAHAVSEQVRADSTLGVHRQFEGLDLVRLPTEALVAYSIDGASPQIVLSDGLVSLLSADELDVVVGHEVAHVREGHGRILRFLAALEAPVPGLRWITSPVRVGMERCADEAAIRRDPVRRVALLEALLKVSVADVPVSVAALTHRSGVVERAQALLEAPPAPTRTQRIAARLTVGAAAACGVLVVGGWGIEAHMLLSMAGICCK